MANLKQTIEFQAKGLAKLKKQYKELEGRTKGLEGATSKAGGGLKGLGKAAGIAGAAFFAGRGIINGLTNSIQLASKFQGVSRGFDNLAKSAGFSSAAFDKFQDATDNTISSVDLMTQANNAMLLGIADSEDQMAELFDVGQRLAQGLGQDTAYGIESLVTGLGRQSKLMLDNLGIMLDVNKANDDYATKLNKTASQLTDAERKQAFVNAAMEEGRRLVEKMGEEQLTMASSMDQAKSAISDVGVEIGLTLAPAVTAIASGFAGAASAVASYVSMLRLSNKEITETMGAEEKEEALLAKIARKKMDISNLDVNQRTFDTNKKALDKDLLDLNVQLIQVVAERKNKELALTLENVDATKLQAEAEKALAEVKNVETADLGTEDFDEFIRQQQEKADAMFVEAEMVKELQRQYPLLAEQLGLLSDEQDPEAFTNFIEQKQKQVDLQQQEKDYIDALIENYPKLAEQLGLVVSEEEKQKKIKEEKQKLIISELKQAALVHSSAMDAMKAVVRAESMEAAAGYIASIFKNVPFPLNLIAAAGAGAVVSGVIDKGLSAFATGTDQIISEPTLALMGEKGAEHVQVTPLNPTMQQDSPQRGIVVNISGGVVDPDYVRNELIPAINMQTGTGNAELNA